MNARLVWDTWRRILTDDELVEWVLNPTDSSLESKGLTAEEIAILSDYASTPKATDTNIGMYRRGLVRNALAALSFVPLTRQLLYMSGADVDEVAEEFVQSIKYVDNGPNFWRVAGAFVAYLRKLPEFGAPRHQDLMALDAATGELAQRLGKTNAEVWTETAVNFYESSPEVDYESTYFVAIRAAVVSPSGHDLTVWLENPEDFDPEEELEPATQYWLIYFPSGEAEREYAELSERAARAFNFLATPRTLFDLSLALDGVSIAGVFEVIKSLEKLGVIVRAGNV